MLDNKLMDGCPQYQGMYLEVTMIFKVLNLKRSVFKYIAIQTTLPAIRANLNLAFLKVIHNHHSFILEKADYCIVRIFT